MRELMAKFIKKNNNKLLKLKNIFDTDINLN